MDGISLPYDKINPSFFKMVSRSRPVMQEEGSLTFSVKNGVVETVWNTTVQWQNDYGLTINEDMKGELAVEVIVEAYDEDPAKIAKALGPAWDEGSKSGAFYFPKTLKAGTKGITSISAPFKNVATTKETFVSWERLDAMLKAVAEKL